MISQDPGARAPGQIKKIKKGIKRSSLTGYKLWDIIRFKNERKK